MGNSIGCQCFEGLLGRAEADRRQPLLRKKVEEWPKTLHFVRHGESEYNVYYEKHHHDPGNLYDAPLTAKGEDQARSVQAFFRDLTSPVELAITSPLTRAIQTMQFAKPFQDSTEGNTEVDAVIAEHLEASCDIGITPIELKQKFPTLNFEKLQEVWWYVPEEHRKDITAAKSQHLFSNEGRRESRGDFHVRVDAAAAMLSRRPESVIAVFAHADFFNTLLCRHFSARDPKYADYWMKNCEVVTVTVTSPTELLSPLKEQEQSVAEPQQEEAPVVSAPAAPSTASLAIAALKKEIAAADPGLKPGQVAKAAALKWKAMDAAERARYL